MLSRSTIQLLRFPFSFLLMPVFWFALSFVHHIDWLKALLAFVLIHGLLYPSSNGYNSYMDRDTGSIGGIEKPMMPEKQLFYVTIIMDIAGIILSSFISWEFAVGFAFYILCSRLYSYRGIRLKRFPVLGYMVVTLNQGALIFAMAFDAADKNHLLQIPLQGMLTATLLIGGFYPITQIYQHVADRQDGVETISMKLGKMGTFFFCAIMYIIAFVMLFFYYRNTNSLFSFFILQIFFLPVLVYFLRWWFQVWKNETIADFKNTMRMNVLASICTNLAFITLMIHHQIG